MNPNTSRLNGTIEKLFRANQLSPASMKPAQLLLFPLLLQSPVSQTSSTPLIVNGVLGESVTLTLKFPVEEKITSITWLHDGKSIVFTEPNEMLNQFPKASAENLQFKNYFSKISFDCSTVFYKWNHKRPVHSKMFKSLSKHPDKEHISCYTQISVSWQRKTSQQGA
ncbi:uncharacterized protein [Tursiops truncatus]|uniref:Uncharacterized protein LOC117312170 isoform X2 n=1 Tax=Tursiops truncatus TaxID=9739 RepID=A0A6J3RAU6_TURTR|nr:uncharacterized protein LOC117312170 isoform X2 [Tursiops truncatus]